MSSSRLPNYLRTYRKRAHLSQDEMAFLIGSKTGARISRYERCRQTPSLRTLLAYELLFRTPIRSLYGGVSEEVENSLKDRIRQLIQKLCKARSNRLSAHKIAVLRALSEQPEILKEPSLAPLAVDIHRVGQMPERKRVITTLPL